MSIAENDVRRGVSGGIGSLLPILPMFDCEPLGLELPAPIKTGGDRAEWEGLVGARLAMLPAIPDAARGKAVRDRVLRAALFLERHGTVSHPSTRSEWRNIVSLLKLTACDADFWSPTGPVVGIDDAQLQERTGLQNPGRMFRQLEKHGLVMRWNSKRNGRRHWRRRFDGTVDASGWSLAPLIFLVDAIELLVDEEHERLRLRCELPQRITVALEAIRRILLSGAIGTEDAVLAEGKAADLAKERDNSRKGRLERLQAAAEHAEALLHGLLSQAIPRDRELPRDENGPVQRDESVPAYTNDHSTSVTVDGLPGFLKRRIGLAMARIGGEPLLEFGTVLRRLGPTHAAPPVRGRIMHCLAPGMPGPGGHPSRSMTRPRWAIAFDICFSTPFTLNPVRSAISP